MLKQKNIKRKWKGLLAAAVAAVTSVVAPVANTSAWDTNIDERYTMGQPSKYGILNHITNNCHEDNYVDGDNTKDCLGEGLGSELEFVRVRVASDTNANFETYSNDGEALRLEAGQTYEVRVYYHTDAMSQIGNLKAKAAEYFINNNYTYPEGYTDMGECGGVGTLYNTRVRMKIPASVAAGQNDAQLGAQFSYDSFHWNNDTNTYYWDDNGQVVLSEGDYVFDSLNLANPTDKEMKIVLDEATVTLHNNNPTNGQKLATNAENDNDIFPSDSKRGGALIGSLEMNGKICACAEYSGYISYTFHTEQADSQIIKEASLDGVNFSKNVQAKPGDTVTYRIRYANNGSKDLTNVTFRDDLPSEVDLIPGTTKLVNNANPDGVILDDVIGINGINTGTYGPGASATITYQVKVKDNLYDLIDCTTASYPNTISVTDDTTGTHTDQSTITITEICDKPNIPQEFPHTGPVEIATAIIAVVCLGVGGAYWYRSQKEVNKMAKTTKSGGKPHNDASTDKSEKSDK